MNIYELCLLDGKINKIVKEVNDKISSHYGVYPGKVINYTCRVFDSIMFDYRLPPIQKDRFSIVLLADDTKQGIMVMVEPLDKSLPKITKTIDITNSTIDLVDTIIEFILEKTKCIKN